MVFFKNSQIPLLVLILILFFSCSAQKPLLISKDKNDATVSVCKNAPFTIALECNPSTGYSWNIVSIDSTAAKLAADPAFTARDSLPGTSGTCFLEFKALKKGTTRITLAYFQEFDRETAPQDSFSVTVIVK
jgi:predicted secreted protein